MALPIPSEYNHAGLPPLPLRNHEDTLNGRPGRSTMEGATPRWLVGLGHRTVGARIRLHLSSGSHLDAGRYPESFPSSRDAKSSLVSSRRPTPGRKQPVREAHHPRGCSVGPPGRIRPIGRRDSRSWRPHLAPDHARTRPERGRCAEVVEQQAHGSVLIRKGDRGQAALAVAGDDPPSGPGHAPRDRWPVVPPPSLEFGRTS